MRDCLNNGFIGLLVLPILLLTSGIAYGAITLWQFDKSIDEAQIRVEDDLARLSDTMQVYDSLQAKFLLYEEAGLDISQLKKEVSQKGEIISQQNFELAQEKFADISEKADELLAQKQAIEEKAAHEARDKLEAKLVDYKNQGVNVLEIDQALPKLRELVDEGNYGDSIEKSLALDKKLDDLLFKKKEEDKRKAEEEAAKKAQAAKAQAQINAWSLYERKQIQTSRGTFTVDIVTINLANPSLRIISDTANSDNCTDNCPTKPLAQYISENGGFAGINGSYFCPPDYASCAGKVASFDTPVYNSRLSKIINADKLFWNGRAFFTFDRSNQVRFFREARDYNGISLSAGMGNFPALIAGGQKVLNESVLDDKLRVAKITRGGIGNKGHLLYIMVARAATVGDLAAIFETLGADNAMNLDGGGSSALFYNGYKVGPGRNLPNAIIFAQ